MPEKLTIKTQVFGVNDSILPKTAAITPKINAQTCYADDILIISKQNWTNFVHRQRVIPNLHKNIKKTESTRRINKSDQILSYI